MSRLTRDGTAGPVSRDHYDKTIVEDHSGHLLAVTRGFAGARNDKTTIRYDDALQ